MVYINTTVFLLATTLLFFPHCVNTEAKKNSSSQKQATSMIKLYIYPNCPYCKKVLRFLADNKYEENVVIVDATKANNLQELMQLNQHNTQVPFLYDVEKNIKMLESDDIIQYLKVRLASLAKA